jgi:hypothetical protein
MHDVELDSFIHDAYFHTFAQEVAQQHFSDADHQMPRPQSEQPDLSIIWEGGTSHEERASTELLVHACPLAADKSSRQEHEQDQRCETEPSSPQGGGIANVLPPPAVPMQQQPTIKPNAKFPQTGRKIHHHTSTNGIPVMTRLNQNIIKPSFEGIVFPDPVQGAASGEMSTELAR